MNLRARLALAALLLAAATAGAAEAPDLVAACGAAADPQTTIERCSQALDEELDGAQRTAVLTHRGLAYFARRDLARAAADLDEAVKADRRSAAAWNARAIVAQQAGDLDLAIRDFDEALAVNPDFGAALANRGGAWLAKGEARRALADLDRAVLRAPARLELALTLRGRTKLALDDPAGALADFDAALVRNPRYANALEARGHALFVIGRFPEAADAFRQAWELRPDAEAGLAWVIAASRAGRDTEAILSRIAATHGAEAGLAPGLALYAGKIAPADLERASADPDPATARARACTAAYALGEWHLARHEADDARRSLGQAAARCDLARPERAAARAELGR